MRAPHLLVAAALASCTAAPPPEAPLPVSAPPEAPLTTAAAPAPAPVSGLDPTPPVARKEPKIERIHGYERADEYAWLRNKGSPDVLGYLSSESAYTDAMMKPTEALQEALYKEMLGRIKETDQTVPYKKGNAYYYTRTEEGKQYPIHCRKLGRLDAPEEVLIDLNEIGKTEKFVGLGPMDVSDDGNLFAYGLDTTGFRQFVLRVKDLRTGAQLPDRVERITSVAFARDNRTLFYVVEDPVSKRAHRLYRHVLGQGAAKGPSAASPPADALLYEEKDEMFDLDVERSSSQEFIFVTSASKTSSEVRHLRADRPDSALTLIAPRERDHEYYVDHRGKLFYIRENSTGRNFRLVTAKVGDNGRAGWKEIVPHRDAVMLENVQVFAGHTVLREREGGLQQLRVLDDKDRPLVDRIPLPEPIYALFPERNEEYASSIFRFNYQSPVTPSSVYDYDVRTRALTLKKRVEVRGGYDPARYEVQRLHASAADGTQIPISLVYRKGISPDGKTPTLLYGYGAYGFSVPTAFIPNRVSLLERGVVFAMAHVRGGGELGKPWHDKGRMMAKRNTFTDFITCAEHLIKLGWATKDRLAIQGGSAGGLLMGAVTNMRPDLWKAVVAAVPFVDVMNTMLDASLPLTVSEFEEWGNPKIKEQYDAMITYSPYDNIARKDYPAILVETSYNDSQVMYWEPAKYVARLRAMKTDKNPLLFKINMQPAGHGGQSGRYNRLRENAFEFAFILTQLGIPR
jgi:oligopeptidase B